MLIGITGKLYSGKTTTANFIKDLYPNTILLAFGDCLKEMIYNAGICSKEELWDKKTKFSRMMLQKIGTEIIRKQVSDNFWVNKMTEKISKIDRKKLIVIHDVRFQNEVDMIHFFHGKIIRIIRPSLKQNKEENKHISETEQDTIVADYEIINKSLDVLKMRTEIVTTILLSEQI